MKRILAAIVLAACGASSAWADAITILENFMRTAKTGRAEFTQVVTGPAKQGQAARVKTSSGTFEFARPDRFRFEYLKPFVQTIVADGQTLWLYDADLNQVTARQQSRVLGSTPAALIAAAPDLSALRRDFDLKAAGEKDGVEWVLATPRGNEGQLHEIKVGFRGNELAALDILDSFGQRSVMTFTRMEVNAAVPPQQFAFKPPKGADLVRQ